MRIYQFPKTVASAAVGLAIGLGISHSAFAAPETVSSWKLSDFDSDGLKSDFLFATVPTGNGANAFGPNPETGCTFATDGNTCDDIVFGQANGVLTFSTGFNFGGQGDFNPQVFGNIAATLDPDLITGGPNDGQALIFTALDLGGIYNGTPFQLAPDTLANCTGGDNAFFTCGEVSQADIDGSFGAYVGDAAGYNVELTDLGGGGYGVVVRYVGTIQGSGTTFDGSEGNWRVEGILALDDAPPTINKTGGDSTVTLGGVFVEPGVSCEDTVDGVIQPIVSGSAPLDYGNIATTLVPNATDLTNVTADFTITYDCTDSQGQAASDVQAVTERQRSVTVGADTIDPVVSLVGDASVQVLLNSTYTDAGATCTDNSPPFDIPLGTTGGPPSFTVTPDPATIDTGVLGTTTLTYSCTDAAGNGPVAVTRDVEVVADSTPPVITLNGDEVVFVTQGGTYSEQGGTCIDIPPVGDPINIPFGSDSFFVTPSTVDTNIVGDTQLIYTCTDNAGNEDTAQRTVSVVSGQSFEILSMTISDVTGPDGVGNDFGGPPDDLAGCFKFGSLDAQTCANANRFSSDGSVSSGGNTGGNLTIPGGGADLDETGNPVGVLFGQFQMVTSQVYNRSDSPISPGFLFGGFEFVPNTFPGSGNSPVPQGFVTVINNNADDSRIDMVSLPFSGVWYAATPNNFFLDPDAGTFTSNVVEIEPDTDLTDGVRRFKYFMTWSHIITAEEDSTGAFVGNNAFWRIEGTITTSDEETILNDAPLITSISAAQFDRAFTRQVVTDQGTVTMSAAASDPDGDNISYDWMASNRDIVNSAIGGTSGATFRFDPSELSPGVYDVVVTVTDDAESPASSSLTLLLTVLDIAPDLGDGDANGNGIPDSVEGFGDSDNDGIPDYLDVIDGNEDPGRNRLDPRDPTAGEIVVSNGIIRLGSVGSTGRREPGFYVTEDEIAERGSPDGSPGSNANDRVNMVEGIGHAGQIVDFEISGLNPGESVQIVIPRSVLLPNTPLYRKYVASFGWKNFALGGTDFLASAQRIDGDCPDPDSGDYDDNVGLVQGRDCVRLTITDGGPNDADGERNGIILDPGVVSGNGPVPKRTESRGGCVVGTSQQSLDKHVDWWLVGSFLAMLILIRRRKLSVWR